MTIPEEAVTAAAREGWERTTGTSWTDASPDEQLLWMEETRATLSVAAPHLMAPAWDEGMKTALEHADDTTDSLGNLYRLDWLDRMEHETNPYKEQP